MLQDEQNVPHGIPVLTRIGGARFKRPVGPGSIIQMQVNLKEKVAGSWFLKGILRVKEKIAVQIDFSCALTSIPQP
jgi:3-hydroxyacyl-[acyl-carrier-protein] dehydratase